MQNGGHFVSTINAAGTRDLKGQILLASASTGPCNGDFLM